MTTSYGFQLGQPWWLLAAALAPLLIWWAWRDLASLGRARRALAAVFRGLTIALLAGATTRST